MSTRFRLRRAVVFALIATSFALAADRPDAPIVVEEIVAKVNGDIITRGELAKSKELIDKEAKAQGITGPNAQQILQKAYSDDLLHHLGRVGAIYGQECRSTCEQEHKNRERGHAPKPVSGGHM